MVLGFRLLACIFFIDRVAATAQKPSYQTICFWDGLSRWRRHPYNSAVSDIPAKLCSAVVYSHVTVDDKSGWIRLTDKELELDAEAKSNANSWMYNPIWLLPPNKVFAQMRDLKKRNSKLKLLLAVGGPHDPVEKNWQLFSKAHLWKDMADSLAKWLKTYDFDGVVLDFFSGTGSLHDSVRSWDNAKFIQPFLRQINQGLKEHKKSWSITFTLPAFDSTTHHLFEIEKLTQEVDFFLVKTSDCLEFPKGALLNVARTMDMTDIDRAELIAMKGAPREKIVLEVPLSGRTYTAVAAPSGVHTVYPGHSGPYTKLQGFLAFFEVCSHIKSGWTRERFGEEACSFLKLADQYVAYEDDESISRKARMVMGRQYRGAAVRSVDLGDYKGECKERSYLLKALRSTLDITGYYVHFYYSPPNTTWWKEIEGKYVTTELPSDSTPSAEPNTTLLHTGNKTQGQPLNASATKESHWHAPFVPFIPAEEGKLSTTAIVAPGATSDAPSTSAGVSTSQKAREAQSTPNQAAPAAALPTAATDKSTVPQNSAWNIIGSIFQKLFPPSVTSPDSPTTPSASPTPKTETSTSGNTPEPQSTPIQAVPPTAQPTAATDKSTAPQNSAWNIIGSIFQELFPQSVTPPVSPTISSAPPTPRAETSTPQNTPEVQSIPIQAESTTEQPTAATDKSTVPQNSAWNIIGSIFQKLFLPSVTSPESPTTPSASPTPKTETSTSGNTPEPQSTPIQAVPPTAQPTAATDKSTAPQNSAWNIIGSIFQELFLQSVTSPASPTTSSAPPTPRVEPSTPQSTPEVQSNSIQAESATAQPTAATDKSTGPQNSAWNIIGSIFQELFPQSVTSPASPTTSSAPPSPKGDTSPAPLMTLSSPSTTKVEASSARPMTLSVPTTTAEASSVQPTTSSVPPTAGGETSPAPLIMLPNPWTTKVEGSSAQPMTPSVPTTIAEASSVKPTMSSEHPTPKVAMSSGQRTASSQSATSKVLTSSSPPSSSTTLADSPTPAVTPVAKANEGDLCKGVEDNKLLPHDSDCTKYYQCSYSRPFLQTCSQGTVFDIQRQICNWPALANRPECI